MIMSVQINGHPANLLVDTGSKQMILDTEAAEIIRRQAIATWSALHPVHEDSGPIIAGWLCAKHIRWQHEFWQQPGRAARVIARGRCKCSVSMAFWALTFFFRHKALINCRTKTCLLQSRSSSADQSWFGCCFRKIHTRSDTTGGNRRADGAVLNPGQPTRLLVDTGAFVTILHEGFVKSLGSSRRNLPGSRHSSADGASKQISAAKINDLKIGDFKVPPEKFGVAPLPQFALRQGSSKIAGILGMDTLYIYHAIIDLDGMNLFLK